jgi:UDP-glucose 4-epimerase
MRALITGGSGYVGSHLCKHFERDSTQIDIARPGRDNGTEWRLCDVRDADAVHQAAVHYAPDIIFHLAAVPGLVAGGLDTQIRGTQHVLSAADAVNAPVVLASSAAVYSLPEFTQGSSRFISEYAIGKRSAELLCECSPVCTVALRLSNIYGPPWPKGVVAAFARAARAGELPTLTDPTLCRDFVHVRDVVSAFVAAKNWLLDPCAPAHDVFDICTGVETSLLTLWERIAAVHGREARFQLGKPRPGDRPEGGQDPTQALDRLGWAAETSLEEGLRELSLLS